MQSWPMSSEDRTYPTGLIELSERYNSRREPFDFGEETLPPIDADLNAFKARIVPDEATRRQKGEPLRGTSWMKKRRKIAEEFVGNSELAYLNALLISNLRKTRAPDHAAPLFLRLWEEQPDHLITALDLRWKVSSIMTFADHGGTDIQRQVGQAMRMMFAMMKLYEFERLYSGVRPRRAFDLKNRIRGRLPMQMENFSLRNGGLDVNTLTPVWELAITDPGIGPLANHLFEELNNDPNTIFRRLRHMRDALIAEKGEK